MTTTTLSKREELTALDNLMVQLPPGYVLDILTELRPEIQRAIADDICFVQSDIDYRAERIADLEKRKAALKIDVDSLQQAVCKGTRDICDLRAVLVELGETADSLASNVRRQIERAATAYRRLSA